ncbi:MAG: RodZ domain-containing protein, partial [Nevskiales bacterium]
QPEVAASEVVLLEVAIPETVAPEAAAAEMAVADEPAAGEAQTPGQILKQARQRRGLSVEDVVDATRMNAETILALEADRDPEQSAWVYVRGFYRRYAKALKIPEEPLLDAHARMHGDARPAAQPVADEWAPQDVSASPSLWPKMIFVLLAGICLGTTVWFLQPKLSGYVEKADIKEKASNAYGGIKNAAVAAKDKAVAAKDKSVAAMGSAAETVKHQSAELAEVANQQYSKAAEKVKTEASPLIEAARAQRESMQKATATEAQSNSEAAAEPQSQTAAAVVQAQPAAAQPEPEVAEPSATEQAMLEPETTGPAGPAESGESAGAASSTLLEMQFSRQTWLSVSDGNGLVLFEDMVEGDTQKRFDAEPPITLFLGTATAAEVWFNGQPVNIASQMRSNGTARLVLGE